MMELVEVTEVEALDDHRIWLRFSDGRTGIRDLSDVLHEGGEMVDPLRDPAVFKRVCVSCGVPTWPNGFDLDADNLHMELQRAGNLAAKEPEFESPEAEARAGLRDYE